MYSNAFARERLRIKFPVLALLALIAGSQAAAGESPAARWSQSATVSQARTAEDEERLLDLAPVTEHQPLISVGGRTESDSGGSRLAARPADGRFFSIYDARSELSRDDDGDGFYHRLKVTFDADVDYGRADVYAKLFLSLEGGPWNHVFTTEEFRIVEDSYYDDYVIVTRLLEGYPAGYYDALIELYDADTGEYLTSHGPYDDRSLSAFPLEDQLRDDDGYAYVEYGGGGAIGWLSLGCLMASAGFRRLKPARPS